MKKIIIDGQNFSNLSEFYEEIEKLFSVNFKMGHNLDAFNDILGGGFGVYDSVEEAVVIWINSEKSKNDFDFTALLSYLEGILETCHPSNRQKIRERIKLAEQKTGDTLFDVLLDIVKGHNFAEFELE